MSGKLEISHKTIFFILFLSALIWFLIQIKDVISMIFVAFILMSAFKPWVDKLEKINYPRALSIITIYILNLTILGFLGSYVLPIIINQSIRLSQDFPFYIKSLAPFLQIDSQFISQYLSPIGENLYKVTLGVFSNIFFIFTVLIVSFYLLIERQQLENHLISFMGKQGSNIIITIIKKVEARLGAWIRGQLTLMLIIGLSTYIGLTLLGIPFAIPLSILAGILELIPIIGPIVSAVPTVLIALTISPFLALASAALYFIIQQAENNILVPIVMKQAVGLPPLVTIIALLIGGKVAGITGAVLAIPIVVTAETIITTYLNIKIPKNSLE